MKKRLLISSFIVIFSACGFLFVACGDAGSDDSAGDGYTFPEQDAIDLNLEVYSALTDYAVKGPGTYSVVVSDQYGSNVSEAQYWNTVTVVFSNHSVGTDLTVNGKGVVKAIMDSYNGMYIVEYSGTFTGKYKKEGYALSMNFKTKWSSSFICEGTFTVNGTAYAFVVDSLSQPGIPTSSMIDG